MNNHDDAVRKAVAEACVQSQETIAELREHLANMEMEHDDMTDIERQIREVVQDMGDPLLTDIVARTHSTYDEVAPTVKQMCVRGVLRQKEDCVDHDWTYRKGHNWDTP